LEEPEYLRRYINWNEQVSNLIGKRGKLIFCSRDFLRSDPHPDTVYSSITTIKKKREEGSVYLLDYCYKLRSGKKEHHVIELIQGHLNTSLESTLNYFSGVDSIDYTNIVELMEECEGCRFSSSVETINGSPTETIIRSGNKYHFFVLDGSYHYNPNHLDKPKDAFKSWMKTIKQLKPNQDYVQFFDYNLDGNIKIWGNKSSPPDYIHHKEGTQIVFDAVRGNDHFIMPIDKKTVGKTPSSVKKSIESLGFGTNDLSPIIMWHGCVNRYNNYLKREG
jgi:hypothetical protein